MWKTVGHTRDPLLPADQTHSSTAHAGPARRVTTCCGLAAAPRALLRPRAATALDAILHAHLRMKNDKRATYITRETILQLLSDDSGAFEPPERKSARAFSRG